MPIDFNPHIQFNSNINTPHRIIQQSVAFTGQLEKDTFTKSVKVDSSNVDNKYEGYHVDNFYGTHIIGPILVKNPCLMNHIVSKLIKRDLKPISYPYEEDSYEVTLNALKERIK